MAGVGFALLAVVILGYVFIGGYEYRAYVIHTGALLGTLMAANVWMRIWPAQQKIITAIRDGQAPDAALVARAGTRSRHNTYMSVALIWTMITQHTTAFAQGGVDLAADRDRHRVARDHAALRQGHRGQGLLARPRPRARQAARRSAAGARRRCPAPSRSACRRLR